MTTAQNAGLRFGIATMAMRDRVVARIRDDRGEGVISMAIAVLIIATIGLALWVVFNRATTAISTDAENLINQVGDPGAGAGG